MFLQRLDLLAQKEKNIQDAHERTKDAKTVSQALTEKASEMQAVKPYKTIKRGYLPSALSPLLSHQVQSLSASGALFMPLFVQTRMVNDLMQLSRLSPPTMGFMPA